MPHVFVISYNDERTNLLKREACAVLNSVEGIYREGKVELLEPPPAGAGCRVIVTFLPASSVDLAKRGIDEKDAAALRQRLAAFAEDWDRPDMDVYDGV